MSFSKRFLFLTSLFVVSLSWIACSNEKESEIVTDPMKSDVIYKQFPFEIQSKDELLGFFCKYGASKGIYTYKKDWCCARMKSLKLFNDNNCELFKVSLIEGCLAAKKRLFDNNGDLHGEHQLIDAHYDNPELFYKNDSLFFQIIIPKVKKQCLLLVNSIEQTNQLIPIK